MFTRFDETNNNKTSSNSNTSNSFTTTPASPSDNYGCNNQSSCLEIINDVHNDSDTNSVDLSSLADDNEDALHGSSSVDLDNFSPILTNNNNNDDKCIHSSKSSNQLYYHHHHGHRNHLIKFDHHHHHNNELINSYCIETDINNNTNNNDANNMSTCLSSPSPLSVYSPVELKHDGCYTPIHGNHHLQTHPIHFNDPNTSSNNEQLLTKNLNLSSNSSNVKSSDRNVHCVKEKIRRDRIKYSCNELRRLIPNLNGLKTDMASLLETSVLWIQLINSNIPQEFLDDVQVKLEKLTSVQHQQQQNFNNSSYSPQRSNSVSNTTPILSNQNSNTFKSTKRCRKSMTNLNKQMLNEEKMRLIKAQQQPTPPALIPSSKSLMSYPNATLISPASLMNTNNVLAAAAVASYHSAIDNANTNSTGLIEFTTSNLEPCSSKQTKMMLLNSNNLTNNTVKSYVSSSQANEFPFKCQYLNGTDLIQQQSAFDYSSNYELYNKLIKKSCQLIDSNINLSSNQMQLKLNSKQLTSDFDLPFQNYFPN